MPWGDFLVNLATLRVDYTFSPRMTIRSLTQYNTSTNEISNNIRFNLIHHPLSDFFIVYNEQQYTDGRVAAGRGVVVKYTHLFSF